MQLVILKNNKNNERKSWYLRASATIVFITSINEPLWGLKVTTPPGEQESDWQNVLTATLKIKSQTESPTEP